MRPTARDPQSLALPVVERGLQESRDREKRDLRERERTHLASISAKPEPPGVEHPNRLEASLEAADRHEPKPGEPRPRWSAAHLRLGTGWIS